jgi:hypothetical protein
MATAPTGEPPWRLLAPTSPQPFYPYDLRHGGSKWTGHTVTYPRWSYGALLPQREMALPNGEKFTTSLSKIPPPRGIKSSQCFGGLPQPFANSPVQRLAVAWPRRGNANLAAQFLPASSRWMVIVLKVKRRGRKERAQVHSCLYGCKGGWRATTAPRQWRCRPSEHGSQLGKGDWHVWPVRQWHRASGWKPSPMSQYVAAVDGPVRASGYGRVGLGRDRCFGPNGTFILFFLSFFSFFPPIFWIYFFSFLNFNLDFKYCGGFHTQVKGRN